MSSLSWKLLWRLDAPEKGDARVVKWELVDGEAPGGGNSALNLARNKIKARVDQSEKVKSI